MNSTQTEPGAVRGVLKGAWPIEFRHESQFGEKEAVERGHIIWHLQGYTKWDLEG